MDKLLATSVEIKSLPDLSHSLATPDEEMRRATEDIMLNIIMNVLKTIGDSAYHMQIYLPVQNEEVRFSVVI